MMSKLLMALGTAIGLPLLLASAMAQDESRVSRPVPGTSGAGEAIGKTVIYGRSDGPPQVISDVTPMPPMPPALPLPSHTPSPASGGMLRYQPLTSEEANLGRQAADLGRKLGEARETRIDPRSRPS